MTEKPKTIHLHEFASDDWFAEPCQSQFWLRIYMMLYVERNRFLEALEGAPRSLNLERPIRLSYAVMGGLKVPIFNHELHCRPDGHLQLNLAADQKDLPTAPYVILTTPYVTDGIEEPESQVLRRIERAAALIRAHTGLNFMRDIVFDGAVFGGEEKFSVPSPTIKMPTEVEGPFLAKANWEQIGEIAKQLSILPSETRNRVNLALSFFDKALMSRDTFFYYWTSLEILCNGGAQTIRERIGACYGATRKQVEDETGFKTIAQWRHDYFHKGKVPGLSADVERYIQLLFLDLLRQELHLPLGGHITSIQNSPGYDLRPIGLADNRTPQQKLAQTQADSSTTF